MQFIEKNSFNVRSAVYHLKKDGTGLKFILFEHIALEDLPSSEEILFQDDSFDKLNSLLVDDRDRTLIANIVRLTNSNGRKLVGVVYCARHMRTAIKFMLSTLNYKVYKAEWVRVFDL